MNGPFPSSPEGAEEIMAKACVAPLGLVCVAACVRGLTPPGYYLPGLRPWPVAEKVKPQVQWPGAGPNGPAENSRG